MPYSQGGYQSEETAVSEPQADDASEAEDEGNQTEDEAKGGHLKHITLLEETLEFHNFGEDCIKMFRPGILYATDSRFADIKLFLQNYTVCRALASRLAWNCQEILIYAIHFIISA